MQDNLPELRDIHLPDGVSFFPPAYGWWVILGCIIFLIASYHLIKTVIRKSKKLFALKALKNIDSGDVVDDAIKISELLRRICVYKYKEAITLFGKEWTEFLNNHCKEPIDDAASELLMNAPYISEKSNTYSSIDLDNLKKFAKVWIGENL